MYVFLTRGGGIVFTVAAGDTVGVPAAGDSASTLDRLLAAPWLSFQKTAEIDEANFTVSCS